MKYRKRLFRGPITGTISGSATKTQSVPWGSKNLQGIKNFLLIIIDFDNKTSFLQILLILGMIALFGLNFGYNEILLLWLKNFLSRFFDTTDLRKFALKYFVVLSLSSLIMVKSIFAFVAIIKNYTIKDNALVTASKFEKNEEKNKTQ